MKTDIVRHTPFETSLRPGIIVLLFSTLLVVLLTACGGPVQLTTFKGNGFSMGVPQDWAKTAPSAGETVFTATDNTSNLDTIVANADPNNNQDTLLDTYLGALSKGLKNVQPHAMASSVQIAGKTWSQKAINGTNDKGVDLTIVALVYQDSTGLQKAFGIGYTANQSSFDQENSDVLQPMLKSFTFSA